LLASDWQWVGLERLPQPLGAGPADLHTVVTLQHAVRLEGALPSELLLFEALP
jgi:hypothetical protein